jgi:hypothetical protein
LPRELGYFVPESPKVRRGQYPYTCTRNSTTY